jgi:DNA-directed RNA polymerase beta subunit
MTRGGTVHAFPEVFIGHVPIMVGSKYSPDALALGDLGGYFVVNGKEKCIVVQTRAPTNVFSTFGDPPVVSMLCQPPDRNTVCPNDLLRRQGRVCFRVKHLKASIPFCTLWCALGGALEDIQDCAFLFPSLHFEPPEKLEPFAREGTTLDQCLARYVFPHAQTLEQKRQLLRKALVLLEHSAGPRTNRDNWGHKRLDTAGVLLGRVFSTAWSKALSTLRRLTQRLCEKGKKIPLYKVFPNDAVTDGLRYALATGNWKTSFSNVIYHVGVAQSVFRYTPTAVLSLMRRVASSFSREAKVIKPRQLHTSAYGFICAVETPEGGSIGLINQLALFSRVSRHIRKRGTFDVFEKNGRNLVFVDGVPVGFLEKTPERAVHAVLALKQQKKIPMDCGCSIDAQGDMWIATETGRLLRPLYFHDALVYISPAALEHVHIDGAVLREVSPQSLFGTTAATIPFPDHNQSPRNVYQVRRVPVRAPAPVPHLPCAERNVQASDRGAHVRFSDQNRLALSHAVAPAKTIGKHNHWQTSRDRHFPVRGERRGRRDGLGGLQPRRQPVLQPIVHRPRTSAQRHLQDDCGHRKYSVQKRGVRNHPPRRVQAPSAHA